MAQIESLAIDEIAGKTIHVVVKSYGEEEMLIVFTDGTMIQFYASVYEEEGSIEECSYVQPDDFRLADLQLAIGHLHPEMIAEREARQAKQTADEIQRNEELERSQYERLKAKFESVQSNIAVPSNIELAS